jgi:AraC-like DNA-binding protein
MLRIGHKGMHGERSALRTVRLRHADLNGDASAKRMSDPPHHVSVFSTDMLPERERLQFFLEEIARKRLRLEVTPYGDGPFSSRFRSARLGAATVVEGTFSAGGYGRSRQLLSDGNDDFAFLLCDDAPIDLDQIGRTIRQGEGALLDNARPGCASCAGPGAGLLILLPRKAFLRRLPGAEDVARLPTVRADRLELALLRNYVAAILDAPVASGAALEVAGAHTLDLVSLALGATGEAAHHASARGLRAARAVAVRQSALAQLRNPNLSAAGVAKANGISERYLRQLFEDFGTSFSEFVIGQRLDLAHRLLVNPLNRHRRISEIAFEAGFSDLSHFNRRFRARFGATPAAARAATTPD